MGMREDGGTVELLRCRFRNGDPAQPLRHDTRDALRQVALDDGAGEWIDDVLIIVSELVQNVTQHTRGPGELIVTAGSGAVFIEVGDASTATPQPKSPGPDRAGGRGLLLIEAISQQWGFRTCADGKVVWARLPAAVDSHRFSAA